MFSQGHTAVEFFRELQTKMTVRKTRPEDSVRVINMSMFNDIDWTWEIARNGFRVPEMVRDFVEKISVETLVFCRYW